MQHKPLKNYIMFIYSFIFLSFLSFLVPGRMDRPNRITFLDSDGATAFEYRVPIGQSDMVR